MTPIRILGLDPGLRHTGWGLISTTGQSLSYIASGVINPPTTGSLAQRLAFLFEKLTQIVTDADPGEAAVEETFVNKNPASALKLGMARGVVLLAPSQMKIPVFEYTANVVKKSVVGTGHADKDQIFHMVRRILPLSPVDLSADAADALATAICHAHHRQIKAMIG